MCDTLNSPLSYLNVVQRLSAVLGPPSHPTAMGCAGFLSLCLFFTRNIGKFASVIVSVYK